MNTLRPHGGDIQMTATYASYVWTNGGSTQIDYLALEELYAQTENPAAMLSEGIDGQKEREDIGAVDDRNVDATEELLRDSEAMASIRKGEADIVAGRTVAWRDIRRD